LPTGQTITPEIICVVCAIIRTTLKNAAEVCKILDKRAAGVTV
jgi:hypothetical protein